jgi:hypothetical protein
MSSSSHRSPRSQRSARLPAALTLTFAVLAAGCARMPAVGSGGRGVSLPATSGAVPASSAVPAATSGAAPGSSASPRSLPVSPTPADTPWTGSGLEPVGSVVDGTSHPRLWVTAGDLPRLRSWTTSGNAVWRDGLAAALQRVRLVVDGGAAADDGSSGWVEDPVESDAELLAFGSLVDPLPDERAQDAERARRLLMHGIAAAAQGPKDGAAYRDPSFSIDDRSRWWGEGWALTVDWIYPILTVGDKAMIRTVFLRWIAEEQRGGQTTSDHPEPIGVQNDPVLLVDAAAVKWSENNYYTAHTRNIALMSLALDPIDDPDGTLHAQLGTATGGFLFVTDALLRGDGRGGAPAEGFEYGPQSLGFIAETLLALHTAGKDEPATLGRQVTFAGNPFWDEVGPFLLHALSSQPVTNHAGQSVYLPASYGDAQTYHNPDWIELFGALGIYDESVDAPTSAARLTMSRWIAVNTPDGGAAGLADRVGNADNLRNSILYFLLLDPTAPTPADPRPSQPMSWLAAGSGRFTARTGWDAGSTWFNFGVGWNLIDHQDGDGLDISLFRNGEWLTKQRAGYDVPTSDQKNTLAIQNDLPEHDSPDDYRGLESAAGSQFTYVPSGPGTLTASSVADDYTFVSGDATDLYNSAREGATDVVQATRDVVWLTPGVVVVYDRATTHTAGRFKRFFLQLPGAPAISGRRAVSTTPSGQRLAVTTLLPADATLNGEQITPNADGNIAGEGQGQVAASETMNYRLRVDAPGGPADVRFLDVLEALDTGTTPQQATHLHTTIGSAFDGAVVGSTVVIFPVERGKADDVHLQVPAGVTKVVVTGLQPATGYAVTNVHGELLVQPGGSQQSDTGGVLELSV